MKITNLKTGTKLMWDAPRPFDGYDDRPLSERIFYPAIVSPSKPPLTSALAECVRITTGHVTNWMGPESDYLREPTQQELETLTWPEPKI